MNHDQYTDQYLRSILESVRTIAMVGASETSNRPSFIVMKYLLEKGFRVVPVNPTATVPAILGQPVYPDVAAVPDAVDMVDIFRRSDAVGPIVDQAIAKSAKVVWMQLGVRNDEAAAKAEAAGLRVVMNRCPKMEYSRLHGEPG